MFRTITFVALVAYVSAQSLSSQCTTSLEDVLANHEAAACLGASSLISVLAGAGSGSSLISSVNTWLTTLCAAPACSNATIAAVAQNITTGCASDLSDFGFTSSDSSDVSTLAQQLYPTVRQVICLADGSTNCVTQTLTNIESVLSVNLTTVGSLISGTVPTDVPSNITCTGCIQAMYNDLNAAFPSIVSDAAPALQSMCGTSFTDGTTPSGIVESASTATAATTSNSAALSDLSLLSHGVFTGLSMCGLVVISTLFTSLA